MRLNKLVLPEDDLLINAEQLEKLAPEQIVIVQTGKMGEPIKALQRMANKQEKARPSSWWFGVYHHDTVARDGNDGCQNPGHDLSRRRWG